MAFTVDRSTVKQYHDGSSSHVRKVGQLTGPASYTSGGEPLTAAAIGMGTVDFLDMEPLYDGTTMYHGIYQHTAGTVIVVDPTTGNEVAGATDLSSHNARFEAIGF